MKDAWNEHIVAPFEDFANDVAELFTPNEETPERGEIINPTPVEERCPWITEGVVGAVKEVGLKVPLVVRLEGTNVDLGKKIIEESGLDVTTGDSLRDAAQKIVELTK